MSSPFLGQILTKMIDGGHASKAPEVPLEPIVPGAWAAWAKAAREEAAAAASLPIPKAATTPRPINVAQGAHR